jgi:hypothetical protein
MNIRTILLLQLLALVTTATRESLEDPEYDAGNAGPEESEEDENEELNGQEVNLPMLDPSDCQFQVIKSCNHQFKSSFERKPGSPARNNVELYCRGIQVSRKIYIYPLIRLVEN